MSRAEELARWMLLQAELLEIDNPPPDGTPRLQEAAALLRQQAAVLERVRAYLEPQIAELCDCNLCEVGRAVLAALDEVKRE